MTTALVDPVTLNITGEHREQLAEALMDAFPTYSDLQQMVQYRMDLALARIAADDNLETVVFKLIERVKADGHFLRLLAAARESRPGNPKLALFAEQFNLAIQTSGRQRLERIIKEKSKFIDIATWRERLGEIEGRVCRIEVTTNAGSVYGTGFLIGPDLVLTNYHVVEAVVAGEGGPGAPQGVRARKSDVTLLFDYKLTRGGQVNPGTPVGLREIVDYSPYDPVDMEPLPKSRDPHPENLDYALLRLETQGTKPFAGRPIGSKPEPAAPPRGSIALPSSGQPLPLPPHAPLCIVQHPDTEPMKLALDEDAIIAVNGNNTRITYKTNTLGGSSGSPCFNQDLELVALHHAGDPKFAPLYHPEFNEGIPITAVLELLEKRRIKLT